MLIVAVGPAKATVFLETFESVSATFTVNDAYWLDHARANGFITKTTNDPGVFGGAFGTAITQDWNITGFFLFEGTASYPDPIPTGHDEFYISPTFAVVPNTVYNVNFFLTNADTINRASVQPEIGGQLLDPPTSAAGTFTSNFWQQFTYAWNSGANTSASLILHDLVTTSTGNDFGIDNIFVDTQIPEPATWGLIGSALAGLVVWRRRRSENC